MRTDVWSWLPDGRVSRLSPGDGAWMQASIHPNGDHAVFWGGPDDSPPRLWQSATDHGRAEPLTGVDAAARHGAYGLLGDRVAFTAREGGAGDGRMADEQTSGTPPPGSHWHICTMGPDGGDVRQVTDGPYVDQRPATSPDGATIAFVSDRGRGIWVVDAGGGEPRLLDPPLFLYRPCWSLDGRSIFAFLITAERRQVGRLDVGTGTFDLLPNDDRGNTHGPFVDPRGDRLIVHSDRDGRWGLHELPLDGSPMRPLRPPGHEDTICGHGTRGRNGVLTFDQAAMVELTR